MSILPPRFCRQLIGWSYLCRQSKIQSHGMMQFKEKGQFVRETACCS